MGYAGKAINQVIRYVAVGLALNLIWYCIYLFMTYLGLSPINTVSINYPLSVILGYYAHRRYTFRSGSKGFDGATFIRYITAYAVGFSINIGMLNYFHDHLGYPHQWVQGIAIFVVAGFLFVAMRYFVFKGVAHA